MLADGDQVARQLAEMPTHDGAEKQYFVAGFHRLHQGRISSTKIYCEGSAELN